MKALVGLVLAFWFNVSGRAEVRVFIQDSNGVALLKYECTSGELVRAFALNVSVDQGQIIGVSDFVRGPSTAMACGYGIFPASFRDHLLTSGTNANWNASDYTPVAVVADSPGDTLPGLGSSGVTLEFGGLWDSTDPAAVPGPVGTLCVLWLSRPTRVSVAPNVTRGGVVRAFSADLIPAVFVAASVGPAVMGTSLLNGLMTISFQDGQLQAANSLNGPWSDTGDFSGVHVESVGTNATRFYRVRGN